jgi:four helix bundle protein
LPYSRGVAKSRQDLCGRALRFAQAVLELHQLVAKLSRAHAHIAQQLFEAVSSIGANLEEGQVAASRRDMASKYAIALRESREARYWLRLLATRPEWTTELTSLVHESDEFVAILTTSVRKLRDPHPASRDATRTPR